MTLSDTSTYAPMNTHLEIYSESTIIGETNHNFLSNSSKVVQLKIDVWSENHLANFIVSQDSSLKQISISNYYWILRFNEEGGCIPANLLKYTQR